MAYFRELVQKAQKGDKQALERLLILYKDLIEGSSWLDGQFDEDLKQFIVLSIIQKLHYFKP